MEEHTKSSKLKNVFVILGVIFAILIIWEVISSSDEQDKTDIKEKIKQNIVYVKYEVTGKNIDGSYFEMATSGSGVIYYINGTQMQILTNRHVIDCSYNDLNCYQRLSEKIRVRTQDGKMHDVEKVLYAPHGLDMTVLELKINSTEKYSGTYIRKEGLQVGEKAIAIGYPSFTDRVLEFSVKEGTITNFRDLIMDDGFSFKAIDSDAYTYFGSSGGGLFDKEGNLIGINTWISGTQTSIGIKINVIDDIETWIYCHMPNAYYSVMEGDISNGCVEYCNRDEILGTDYGCYKPCNGFYCESKIPSSNDSRCNEGYILGNDNYCHLPCGSSFQYCPDTESTCYKDKCLSCSYGTILFEDGTCKLNR